MKEILPGESARFVRAVGPEPDEVLEEMDRVARENGFPHVGPEVGGWLEMLARLVPANRVFEFGSGFGYSAYWFARAVPDGGEIVLTENDAAELDMARQYLARGGFDDLAVFEHGDAISISHDYEGPFDVVLIDVWKDQYDEAFAAIREKVAGGGVIIADNVMTMTGPEAIRIQFDELLELQEGNDPGEVNRNTRGIAEYLDSVRDAPEFETAVIPVGKGIAISHRTE